MTDKNDQKTKLDFCKAESKRKDVYAEGKLNGTMTHLKKGLRGQNILII